MSLPFDGIGVRYSFLQLVEYKAFLFRESLLQHALPDGLGVPSAH